MKILTRLIVALALVVGYAAASNADDREDVINTVKGYVLGFYEGDVERLDRVLDPTLRKLGWWRSSVEKPYGGPFTMTQEGAKEFAPKFAKSKDNKGPDGHLVVTVFEVMDKTASAKVEAVWGIDYLHLAKTNGEWKILNVIWQSYPDGNAR